MGGEPQLFQHSNGVGGAFERPHPDLVSEPRALARASDPATSHEAAEWVAPRSGSQKAKLLLAHRAHRQQGLTDEEAAREAGLLGSGFWKRCSELRNAGLIAETGEQRRGSSGLMAQVCRITARGYVLTEGWAHAEN